MNESAPKPDFANMSLSSVARRKLLSLAFLSVCVIISTASIVILGVLLLSIVLSAIPAFGPHADTQVAESRVLVIPQRPPGNGNAANGDNQAPPSLATGDGIQGIFHVTELVRGGLGDANDISFQDAAGGGAGQARIGLFSFRLGQKLDETAFELLPATGNQNVLELARQIGVTVPPLASESNNDATILVLHHPAADDFQFDELEVEGQLVVEGKLAGRVSAAAGWRANLVIGQRPQTTDFATTTFTAIDLDELKRVRPRKTAGRVSALQTVLWHDLVEGTRFQPVKLRSFGGDRLIQGDLKIEAAQLDGLSRSRKNGFDFGGEFKLVYCPTPEPDATTAAHVQHFLKETPKSDPAAAGIGPALWGSIWVCLGCALFALPLGVGTAVFLEEFKPTGKFLRFCRGVIQLNITNLAGVPSIVYGILGLTAFATMFGLFGSAKQPKLQFGVKHYYQYLTEGMVPVTIPVARADSIPQLVDGMEAQTGEGPITLNIIGPDDELPEDQAVLRRTLRSDAEGGPIPKKAWYYVQLPFGRGVLAASLTLMLVILPVIIIASQEALRAVPSSLREGALGLGSTPWQVVRHVTLPAAIPSIMTGAILSMSRAIGEAAPVLMLCGIVYIASSPKHLMDTYSVLPIQIFYWSGLPVDATATINFQNVAAGGIVVLLTVLLTFNSIAIAIRHWTHKPLS